MMSEEVVEVDLYVPFMYSVFGTVLYVYRDLYSLVGSKLVWKILLRLLTTKW
jgi:hypothetical protein